MLSARADNWKTLTCLFQGYINDFGAAAGQEIIRAIVDELGGLRISFPECQVIEESAGIRVIIPKRNLNRSENFHHIGSLYLSMRERFGEASGRAIIYKLMLELKSKRVCFPDGETLYRIERDEKIRRAFNGNNAIELAIIWDMTPQSVRRIVSHD